MSIAQHHRITTYSCSNPRSGRSPPRHQDEDQPDGPPTPHTPISFDHGAAHFIVLDDIEWIGADGERRGHYRGGLDETQLAFVRRDLEMVPEDQLIVLFMHVPLFDVGNPQALYRLIEERPFTLSVSGHTHTQAHRFLGAEDGWRGPEPHHHDVHVTVSGSWWSGAPDERGIRHKTMRDGGRWQTPTSSR